MRVTCTNCGGAHNGEVAGSNPAVTTIQKRPRGRPKTIADMRAYKAQKQREYRAAKRLALSNMTKGDGNE